MKFNLVVLLALRSALAAEIYHEPLRPQFHFSPAKNWTNDPNGLVYYKDEYHMFFQHNPYGDKWGHMSWGHAVSKDMVHWTQLPLAIAEDNGVMAFSGSVVVDPNTSGLCTDDDCLVAIYTGHTDTRQSQYIAVSNDRGRTWAKFGGNPVLDLQMKNFRDPKVFWYAQKKYWVMAVALPDRHKIRFYKSANLKAWELLSEFGPAGATGGDWECPDLFALSGKWVLSVNLNPGGPQGGSGNQYFVGTFDGVKFNNANPAETVMWADYGADWYASTSFFGMPDARRVWIGWLSNWLYAGDEPTSPWRGVQSFPRVLSLKDGRLVQAPIDELKKQRESPVRMSKVTIEEANKKLAAFHGQSYELEVEGAAEVHVLKGEGQETVVSLKDGISIDRRKSGNVGFAKDFSKVHASVAGRGKLARIFVDQSVVEVFANDGTTVLTDRVFPSAQADGLSVSGASEADKVTLTVWKMRSSWK